MKRLFLVLGFSAAALGTAMAQFNINYPTYAYAFTNAQEVDFFVASPTTTGSPGALGNLTGYYSATPTGLQNCINTAISALSLTASGTQPTTSAATTGCKFAPNNVATSGFSVDYTGINGFSATDASILVITNSNTWTVSASLSAAPTGGDLYIMPGYVNTSSAIVSNGGAKKLSTASVPVSDAPGTSNGTTTGTAAGSTDALYTQYANAYVIPVMFYLQYDPFSSTGSASDTPNLTFSVAAP